MTEQKMRVFKIREQIRNIHRAAKSFVILKKARKERLMNKKFKERIMLAITEVNGCELCSYVHTKTALSAGMKSDKIKEILNGNIQNVPEEEAVAVMFGQHFAFSKEQPDNDTVVRLIEDYGYPKANAIFAASQMITMTNGMGISMHLLLERLKLNRDKRSNFVLEIFNPLLTMMLFPLFIIEYKMKSLFVPLKAI